MKKNILFFALFVALTVMFFACKPKPEPDPTPASDPIDIFCGTYDLTIVTDSVQNGSTWFNNASLPASASIPTRYGRLTITKVNPNKVDVLGRIDLAGDSVDYYRTTGALDADGRLQLESGQDFVSSTRTRHFTFAPITAGGPLVFKSDASYSFNGTAFIERATNTATKR